MSRLLTPALLTLGVLLWSLPALAAHEDFRLAPGFTPDPATGSGISGGSVDASRHGDTSDGPCVGQIDSSPDHKLTLTANFSYLRIQVASRADTSLVIKGPRNAYRCADDVVGLDPAIEGAWPAGTYEIYVGSVDEGEHPYTIAITEIRPDVQRNQGQQRTDQEQTRRQGSRDFASVTIAPGFTPDPLTVTGKSGGPTDASRLGNSPSGPCVGMIDTTPDHEMTLTSDFDYLELRVESRQDTSLVIQGPGGNRCNDDDEGLNPGIRGAWRKGTYKIFVGSVDEGVHPYRLHITEIR